MPEPRRYEAERSAWIKSRRWLDRAGANRRAEILAREARKRERAEAGIGESLFHEAETRGSLHRWTHHDDASTSALGFVAWVIVHVLLVPIYLGLAWVIGQASYRAWEMVANQYRVRVTPYLVAAAVAGGLALLGRPLGWDLWAIHGLAATIEQVTGGWIAPRALSGWYAAGWISWLEIQVALGFLYGGWLAYAWGWTAPAVRRGERAATAQRRRTPDQDPAVKIIRGAAAAAQTEGEVR